MRQCHLQRVLQGRCQQLFPFQMRQRKLLQLSAIVLLRLVRAKKMALLAQFALASSLVVIWRPRKANVRPLGTVISCGVPLDSRQVAKTRSRVMLANWAADR